MIKMFELPNPVLKCIKILKSSGFDHYLVGGSVRDLLLKRVPKDYDLATNATTYQIKNLFRDYHLKTFGEQRGTIMVIIDRMVIEISQYKKRKDLRTDLEYRDFTINALAYSKDEGIIDYYGGLEDLEKKIIRGVKNPKKRIHEDPLRILRGLRFASTLGFIIDKKTSKLLNRHKGLLKAVAMERIKDEFNKILSGNDYYKVLSDYQRIIEVVIPELFKVVNKDQYLNNLKMIKDLKVEGSMKLALLFYKSNYTDDDLLLIESGLRRLRMAKRVIREVIIIIAYLIESLKLNKYYLRKAINKLGFSNLEAIINVKRHLELEDEDKLLDILDLAILIETKKEVTSLEDLKITGKDLIKIGIDEGPLIGEILNFLLKEVINGHIANEYNSLIKAAREKNIIKTF